MNKEKIQKFSEIIKNSKNILLINHIRMDGDAFWALGWLYFILKKLGKNVKATNDSKAPESFSFLWANEIIETNLNFEKENFDTIISLDAASIFQLWETYKNNEDYFKKANFVVIDHHMTNPLFWDLNLVDASYASTCEIVFEIAKELNWTKYIEKKEATLIITWIYTDTNIYYNQSTSSRTLRIWADLMDLWADFRAPIFEFFKKESFKKLKLLSKIYTNLTSIYNWKIVYSLVSKDDFSNSNTSLEDTSWIINKLSNIEWAEVIFLVYETDFWVKASFRSKDYNVWSLAASFENGWWHKNAAWFSWDFSLEEAKENILEKLKRDFN